MNEWTPEEIQKERERQTVVYKEIYPDRTDIPDRITNWVPKPTNQRMKDALNRANKEAE